jgi:hypothetical protein
MNKLNISYNNSIKNFFSYLPKNKNLIIIYTNEYSGIITFIKKYITGYSNPQGSKQSHTRNMHMINHKNEAYNFINFYSLNEAMVNLGDELLIKLSDNSNSLHLVLFYNALAIKEHNESALNKVYLNKLREYYTKNHDKCTKVNDIYDQFFDLYHSSPTDVINLNKNLIELCSKSNQLYVTDNNQNLLIATPDSNQTQWFNVDGKNHHEVTISEIAMKPIKIDGKITFSGSILCKIPFYKKYGIIDDTVDIFIKNNCIYKFNSTNANLLKDLNHFLQLHPGNSKIEEFGIGTNPNVSITGLNTISEERKAGFHLGIGGEDPGSTHLDFIFSYSKIYADDNEIFDGQKFLSV